tara:strand:- start:212 stop:850 length:639 start_codon:yes stop_codon:yes gene_type:complete
VSESKINSAIATAMGQVQKLAKDERNAHGNYSFASIDKFLDLCRPIMAGHGLHVNISGLGAETFMAGSNKLWCKFSYVIKTCHESGETTGESGMDVLMPLTGAQTSGSAQSYALKQYLRGLLLISTGEKDDPDFSQSAPSDGVDGVVPEVSTKTPEYLEAEVKSKKTLVALNQWNQDNAAEITRLQKENPDAFQRLYSVWQEKEKEIQNGST